MTAILNSVQRPCLEPEFIVQVSGVGISSTMAGSLSTPTTLATTQDIPISFPPGTAAGAVSVVLAKMEP